MAELFIGRQPVFDQAMDVWGYELLFRSGADNRASFDDAQQASSQVIVSALVEFGLERLVGDAKALVNLPRALLLGEQVELLPPGQAVLEVLEDVELDDEVVTGVKRLQGLGYTIALDDFAFEPRWEPLMDVAGVIKVEVPAIAPAERERLKHSVRKLKTRGVVLLAEKVETQEEFEAYRKLGFDLFQGYFFSRPNVVQGSRIPGNRMQVLKLLTELNRDDIELEELDALIKTNVDMSYKLMRFVNSSRFALTRQIDSVRDALVLAGLRQVKSLASMVALCGIDDKPDELIELSLVRARMCEQLAATDAGANPQTAFTVGMLSTLDALLDRPLDALVDELPLADDVRAALTVGEGPLGRYLAWTLGCEKADWTIIESMPASVQEPNGLYVDAVDWARGTLAELAA